MSKTKVVGYLMVAVAVLNVAIDVLNGGGFDFNSHINSVLGGLTGAGLVSARLAIDKVLSAVKK